MRRIKIFIIKKTIHNLNFPLTEIKSLKPGLLLPLPDSISNLNEYIFEQVGETVTSFYTFDGAQIIDVSLLRDDEVIFAQSDSLEDDYHTKWIELNIGGRTFLTTRETLTKKDPDSMLAKMFQESGNGVHWENQRDPNGAFVFDRSGDHFAPLLNYLRHGQLILDPGLSVHGVLEEARFFQLQHAIEILSDMLEIDRAAMEGPLNRRDMMRYLMGTSSGTPLRCQGINLEGADLSRLDLSGVNFNYAILRRADLSGANLRACHFDRAECHNAVFDRADMACVQMKCAILDDASMKQVNFEDSEGVVVANLEGASLKGVNLESSQMQGVNLRVASLKNARLLNCNMRTAILAGTDLENADLSGSDLQEANLRGANVKNCAFGELKNPIHMNQYLHTLRR